MMIRPIRNGLLIFLISLAPVVTSGSDSSPQHFNVVAKRFSFEPGQIAIADHREVILELTSEDVTHGLKCKELGFNSVIHKGSTMEVTFTPQHAGRFIARCSHFCGVGHGSMTFVITVVDE